jgi:hypothetical protein
MKIGLPLILGFDQMSDCQLLKKSRLWIVRIRAVNVLYVLKKKSQKISLIWLLFLAVTQCNDFLELMDK